jgi:hypothetical protein
MAGNVTTVTHPDGTVSKRTSKTMTYTHAVQVSPADPYILAEYFRREAIKSNENATKLRTAADARQVTVRSRGFGQVAPGDLNSHQATLSGTDREIFTWCSADGHTRSYPEPYPAEAVLVPVEEYLAESARRSADAYVARATALREQADATLAACSPVGSWSVERWSTRQDLAHKAVATFRYLVERGHRVTVVPVDVPTMHLMYVDHQRTLCDKVISDRVPATTTMDDVTCAACLSAAADVIAEDEVDPAEDCEDECCTEVAAQDVEANTEEENVELNRASLDALGQRMEWRKANPDAVVYPTAGQMWETHCKGGPTCASWNSSEHLTEREAQVAYGVHRNGGHVAGPRIQVGDIVTIHRGVDLREVLGVDLGTDQVRVASADPSGSPDPWWVSAELVHRAAPVPVRWGQVLELPDGRRYALLSDDHPYLHLTR